MEIFTKSKGKSFNVSFRKSVGEEAMQCPACSSERKKSKLPCFSFNHNKGVGSCSHCGEAFYIKSDNQFQKKEYIKPEWKNNTELSDNVVQWFKGRGITQKTLIDLKITEGKEWMPKSGKEQNTIQFNYFKNNELLNVKFRSGDKGFKLVKDAELIFYNIDAIKETSSVVITEGEIDCLSYIEAGITNVISVPNGASKNAKLEYLDNCWQYFEGKEKIYLATDNDDAGRALRDELAYRLDVDKCYKIDFKDCKDANEYLLKYNKLELEKTIENATQFPLEGVVEVNDILDRVNDLYNKGLQRGLTLGYEKLDTLISFIPAQTTAITGIPNDGKSDWLDQIMERMALLHKWKFGVCSPENHPIELHIAKLAEKLIGKSFNNGYKMSVIEKDMALPFIHEHFKFVSPKNEDFTTDNILSISKGLVMRYGINGFVIDPYNSLEHEREKGQTETDYTCKFYDKLNQYKKKLNLHYFIVAHPTKMHKDRKTGKREIPTLYDISGSAHHFNKPDNGMCVFRDYIEKTTLIYVQKVKHRHLGEKGESEMRYNINNGRYCEAGSEFDNANHLLPKEAQETQPKPNDGISAVKSSFYEKEDDVVPF